MAPEEKEEEIGLKLFCIGAHMLVLVDILEEHLQQRFY
jgi:hypothetical protein